MTAGGLRVNPLGAAQVWEVATARPVTPPLRHDFRPGKNPGVGIQFAAFSPDGRRVITVSANQVQAWDAAGGQPLGLPLRQPTEIWHQTLSPDGSRILIVNVAARVWDLASQQPVTPPLHLEGFCQYATFSPDGRYLVTVGRDRVARVWEAATGQPITPPLKHDSDIRYAAFTPGG